MHRFPIFVLTLQPKIEILYLLQPTKPTETIMRKFAFLLTIILFSFTLSKAQTGSGTDVTSLITNPTFNGNVNGWTVNMPNAQNKGYQGSSYTNVIFINADNEHLVSILPDNAWVAPYSQNPANAEGCVIGQLIACDPYLRLRWCENGLDLEDRNEEQHWYEVSTHLIGSYNLDNVLAAITIGLQFAVSPSQICHALENYEPTNNRSQLKETPYNHLIVDAYNANPTSMEAALDNFSLMQVSPKMAIIGEMRELGESSREEHGHIIKVLKRCRFDQVWLVGDEFKDIKCHYRKFHDVEEVKAAIAESRPEGYYILIKGSNGNRLYQLAELL